MKVAVEKAKLPWRGIEADKERWRLGQTNYHARTALDLTDALKGCIKVLDMEKLPSLLEQAETCVSNISGASLKVHSTLQPRNLYISKSALPVHPSVVAGAITFLIPYTKHC